MGVWFRVPLWARVLLGLALGAGVGLALRYSGQEAIAVEWIKPWGDAFVRLVRMLIVPLIFTTLVAGVVALGDLRRLGSIGGRAIMLFLLTTLFAVSLGLALGTALQPGRGIDPGAASPSAVEEVSKRLEKAGAVADPAAQLLAIIPDNPVAAMANMDVLAIIFFAVMFGVSVLMAGEAGKPVGAAVTSAADATIKMTEIVMETAPIGVFALMAWVMATQGLAILDNLLLLAVALYAVCLIQMLVVYGGLIRFLANLPVARFFAGMRDAQAVAFSTASSNATLPVNLRCVTENLGVSKTVAATVLPLGATANMDGTAAYLGLIALFAAQALGISLDWNDYLYVAFAATLASVGAAGIPSASLFLASIVLTGIGVTPEQAVLVVAFIFPFDRLLDMMRTTTNITGDAAVSVVVARWEREIDVEAFRARKLV